MEPTTFVHKASQSVLHNQRDKQVIPPDSGWGELPSRERPGADPDSGGQPSAFNGWGTEGGNGEMGGGGGVFIILNTPIPARDVALVTPCKGQSAGCEAPVAGSRGGAEREDE